MNRRNGWGRLALLGTIVALVAAFPAQARGQAVVNPTDRLAFDRPESWALAYFASATLLSGLDTPRTRHPGSVSVGFEAGWLPALSESQRRVGFDGTKPEDLNKTPLVLRPRVTIGLPRGLSLIVAATPPVRSFGVTPRLLAVALERPLRETPRWTVGVRGYGQVGSVTGAYTCPPSVLAFEPGSPGNLYGCEGESSDRARLDFVGAEGSVAYRPEALRALSPHATLALNYLDVGFQVNAPTFGYLDRTHLLSRGVTWSTGAGISSRLTSRLDLAVDVFYTPLSVRRAAGAAAGNDGLLNVRTLIAYRLR